MIDTSHAPGCFGSALMCCVGSPECDTCLFVASCAPLSSLKRAALHASFGFEAQPVRAKASKVAKPAKVKTTKVVEASRPASRKAASAQGRALVAKIEATGISVGPSLRKGINPFVNPAFLRVTCHLLLKRPEGIAIEMLEAAFARSLAIDVVQASNHSNLAIETLTALDAADVSHGRLILRM